MFVSEIVGYDCYYKIGMKLSILFYWHPMECCLAELLLGAAPHYRECQIACMPVFAFLYCCNKLFVIVERTYAILLGFLYFLGKYRHIFNIWGTVVYSNFYLWVVYYVNTFVN